MEVIYVSNVEELARVVLSVSISEKGRPVHCSEGIQRRLSSLSYEGPHNKRATCQFAAKRQG